LRSLLYSHYSRNVFSLCKTYRNGFPDSGTSDLDPSEEDPLFDDIFSCIRPKYLSIILPDSPAAKLDSSANSSWMPQLQHRADHVEVMNYSRGDGIPVASSSLIINFRQWDHIDSRYTLTRLDTNLVVLSHDLFSMADIAHLQFVGIYGPSDVNDSGRPIDNMEVMEYIASEMEGVQLYWEYERSEIHCSIRYDIRGWCCCSRTYTQAIRV
jgi:hypothetical protein